MHGVWDAMDLAGNAEDCALPPENYKPCNLASALLRLGHGLSPYKKAKKQIFLRERAPDEICFYLFYYLEDTMNTPTSPFEKQSDGIVLYLI